MYNKDAGASGERGRFINSPARHTDGDFQQVKLFGYVKLRFLESRRAAAPRGSCSRVSNQPSGHDRFHEIVPSTGLFLPARDRNTFYNRITPDASFFPPG